MHNFILLSVASFLLLLFASFCASLHTTSTVFISSISEERIVYFIRHAEKPKVGDTLSREGYQRAQCLATRVFAGQSQPQFPSPQRIIAQPSTIRIKSKRPVETVEPLSKSLDIPIETGCEREQISCVIKALQESPSYPVLVSWQHHYLGKIVQQLTGLNVEYPKDRFDLVWILNLNDMTLKAESQSCNINSP